jgi:hypothetical protein
MILPVSPAQSCSVKGFFKSNCPLITDILKSLMSVTFYGYLIPYHIRYHR